MKWVLLHDIKRVLLDVYTVQRLRPLSYSKSHVILIAFAIDTPDTLENVTSKVGSLAIPFFLPLHLYAPIDIHLYSG